MIEQLNVSDIASQIDLPTGGAIVLLDRLGKGGDYSKDDLARNIFRVDADGHIEWRVRSKFDNEGNPFTRIHLENGLIAYRWDGGSYSIDLKSGEATPLALER